MHRYCGKLTLILRQQRQLGGAVLEILLDKRPLFVGVGREIAADPAEVVQVDHRVPQRADLPVDDCVDLVLRRMHDNVVEADVAVYDAGGLGGDHVRVEVAAQPTHVIRQLGFASRLLDFRVDRVV